MLDISGVEKLILDCDGIISSFHEDCYKIHKPNGVIEEDWTPNEHNFESVLGLSKEGCFERLTIGWWNDMGRTPWFDELMLLLKPFKDAGKLAICTAYIEQDHRSLGGKVDWLKKHVPDIPFFLGKDKHFLANPTSILIDDSNHNSDAFENAGGRVILFPRHWNRNFEIKDSILYTRMMLDWHVGQINALKRDTSIGVLQ